MVEGWLLAGDDAPPAREPENAWGKPSDQMKIGKLKWNSRFQCCKYRRCEARDYDYDALSGQKSVSGGSRDLRRITLEAGTLRRSIATLFPTRKLSQLGQQHNDLYTAIYINCIANDHRNILRPCDVLTLLALNFQTRSRPHNTESSSTTNADTANMLLPISSEAHSSQSHNPHR